MFYFCLTEPLPAADSVHCLLARDVRGLLVKRSREYNFLIPICVEILHVNDSLFSIEIVSDQLLMMLHKINFKQNTYILLCIYVLDVQIGLVLVHYADVFFFFFVGLHFFTSASWPMSFLSLSLSLFSSSSPDLAWFMREYLKSSRTFVHGHTFLHSWSLPMTLVVGLSNLPLDLFVFHMTSVVDI